VSKSARSILHAAYTFVRSVESNKAASALTLDHLLQEHITSIKQGEVREILDGKGESIKDAKRASKIDELTELEKQVTDLVSAIGNAGDDPAKLSAVGLTIEDFTAEDEA
jgi:hypothetical protein